jgi:hypothetical protein
MSDHLASKSDEAPERPVGSFLAPSTTPLGRMANDRRASSSDRHRHRHRQRPRQPPRSGARGPSGAHDGAPASQSAVSARSPDGVLTFMLCPRPRGVVVQRSELRHGDRRVVQLMLFASAHAFVMWCESDQLRFAYPMLFINLARSGRDLFDSVG